MALIVPEPEVKPPTAAALGDFDDEDAFAGALTRVLGDPGIGRSLGKNARLHVESHWTWQVAREKLEATLASLAGESTQITTSSILIAFAFAMIWVGVLLGSLASTPEGVNGIAFAALFPLERREVARAVMDYGIDEKTRSIVLNQDQQTAYEAIVATVNRGAGKEVAPPFHEAPPDCIGCLACAEVCPTDCIPYTTSDARREIWGKDFEMVRCPHCGRAHITKEQSAFYGGRNGVPASYFETCDACKRKQMARSFESLAVAR